MRIAQVAPLYVPVPPERYGGTERVIHDLTEGLAARGHEVTLFASGDSRTCARLVPAVPAALWGERSVDAVAAHFRMHAEVFARAAEFDVIHTHTDYFAFPYIARSPAAVLTTLHGRTDAPELRSLLRLFSEARVIAISESQRALAPEASWAATVHHGLPLEHYRFDAAGGESLLYLGRMAPEKAPQVAIDIALAAGIPLTLAGRVDPVEREFFEREVRPRLGHPLIRFAGEVSDDEKLALLRRSRALLFPIDWPEPFGLVMAEAMACGTPVLARPKGAAPEVVVHGVTGFLADTAEELVAAARATHRLDRGACRRHVETRFSVAAMVARYEAVYSAYRMPRRSSMRRSAGQSL